MSKIVPHIMVIDPGVRTPEIDTFNIISALSPIPCTYHLPALFGFDSFPQLINQLIDQSTVSVTDQVRGIIVLGSAASVHDDFPWQRPLENWLRPAIERGIPILGCCYGHQMLAHMLGGKVEFINTERSKLKGVRRVEILENSLWTAGDRHLIVTHAEMVTGLPPDSRILAKSDEIAIDGFMLKNKPVFGFQPHPEATKVFLDGHEILDPKAVGVLHHGHELIRKFVHMASGK